MKADYFEIWLIAFLYFLSMIITTAVAAKISPVTVIKSLFIIISFRRLGLLLTLN